ncbi:hypothetical protein D3C85_1372660 [compost metagenome]
MECLIRDAEDLTGPDMGQLDCIKMRGENRRPLLSIVQRKNITNLIGNQHDLGHIPGEPVIWCIKDVLVRLSRSSVHCCELGTQVVQRLPVKRLDQQFTG